MAVEVGEAFRIDDIAACCGCSATTVERRIAEVRGLLEAALE